MLPATHDTFSLTQLAQLTGGELQGDDAEFSALSIDSRSISRGELFVALCGPRFDGHAFVNAAQQRGAVALLVEHAVASVLPQVIVNSSRRALGLLAAAWRMQYQIPLIAVTGSNGKTTVKEMLAAILAQQGTVLATRGNLNNEIGVPLTLMQIKREHQYAVIEMGANHHGEISYLTQLAKPTVALVNNAGPAHLEGFGDVAGVARAKGEIFEGLPADGVAIINVDDDHAAVWLALCADKKQKSFGIEEAADVSASDLQPVRGGGYRFKLHTDSTTVDISLPLPGRHNVMNALAASAAALAAGATLSAVKAGLTTLADVNGRLQIKQSPAGITVIDDTYNANPASLQAGLNVLHEQAGSERIVVLGDMGELGGEAAALHRQMGDQIRASGVGQLFTVGELAQLAGGSFGDNAHHFTTQAALIVALKSALLTLGGAAIVMVKGSRSMQMEKVVAALLEMKGISGGADKTTPLARAVGMGS